MFWYTHALFGLSLVSLITSDPSLLVLGLCVSIIPDLDKLLGHRRWFSHSPFSAAFLSLVVLPLSSPLHSLVVFVSLISHILLDLVTKSGLPLLYPVRTTNYGLRLVSAHSKRANKLFMLLGLLILLCKWTPKLLR